MLSDQERKDMQAGSAPDGGFFVPPANVGRIVAKVYELSPIRQIASAINISGLALEGVIDNDQAGYGWTTELGTRSGTTSPQIGKYRIEANEMYAMPKISQTLLDDSAVDVEAWLDGKVANRFARVEAAAFITGTGVDQPFGYTSYPATVVTSATANTAAWGNLEAIKTGANGDFVAAASGSADCLFDVIQSMKTAYLQNATWVTLRAVIAKIRKFRESTTNAYMWQPGLAKGTPDTLLGYPIVIAQDTPAIATGSLSMTFGDFREAYQIVDRIGIRTLRDPYTSKPNVLFYSTRRVGGGVVNFEAIKHVQFSA
jgi:HK97 family phage major capsid protein